MQFDLNFSRKINTLGTKCKLDYSYNMFSVILNFIVRFCLMFFGLLIASMISTKIKPNMDNK